MNLKFPLVQRVRTWRSSDRLQRGKSARVGVSSFLAESQGLIVIGLIVHLYAFTTSSPSTLKVSQLYIHLLYKFECSPQAILSSDSPIVRRSLQFQASCTFYVGEIEYLHRFHTALQAVAMPSRTGYVYCTCEAECSANGGIDADGKFKGVKMTTSEFKAHCRRIRREALERAGEDLFVSTVSDGHISSLPRPASIAHPPTLISLPSSAAGPASITQPLTSSDTTLPLSSPSLINPNLRTHTNRELSEDTMPLLISDDEDDEADKAISLASRRRERNKRTVTDKTILENIKRKIEECTVTASRPVLQETQNTIQTL